MTITETNVLCPYFVKEEIKRGVSSIVCKAFTDEALSVHIYFKNKNEKQEYMKQFCCDYCYQGCALAVAIEEYEKGGEN